MGQARYPIHGIGNTYPVPVDAAWLRKLIFKADMDVFALFDAQKRARHRAVKCPYRCWHSTPGKKAGSGGCGGHLLDAPCLGGVGHAAPDARNHGWQTGRQGRGGDATGTQRLQETAP